MAIQSLEQSPIINPNLFWTHAVPIADSFLSGENVDASREEVTNNLVSFVQYFRDENREQQYIGDETYTALTRLGIDPITLLPIEKPCSSRALNKRSFRQKLLQHQTHSS